MQTRLMNQYNGNEPLASFMCQNCNNSYWKVEGAIAHNKEYSNFFSKCPQIIIESYPWDLKYNFSGFFLVSQGSVPSNYLIMWK